jgi:hypothetical protein
MLEETIRGFEGHDRRHDTPRPASGRIGRMQSSPLPAPAWKPVALPAEHGGWGFLAEPVILGLVLGASPAGACLAFGALAGFLARHPLRLWLLDRRKGVRYPRTALAARFFVGYAALASLFLAGAFALTEAPFWPALALAAPIALLALSFDARGRSRDAVPEASGAIALGSSAAAIALASGAPPGLAWGAWALLALRAVTSVLYVRARIRLDRGVAAGPVVVLAGHATALAVAAALARSAWAPWLATGALLVLLARAAWGLSPLRRRVRPQVVGFQELGFGLLTLTLLAFGYRIGL